MNFNTEAVTDLKAFHKQLKPEEEWDMSVATLLMVTHFLSLILLWNWFRSLALRMLLNRLTFHSINPWALA